MALGLAIIYRTSAVINLAHGEFVMLGAYSAWALQTIVGLGPLESLVIIFLMVLLLGWLVGRGVIPHLYKRLLDPIAGICSWRRPLE